jgi:thiol-disulfide isomerase/thioredoxin
LKKVFNNQSLKKVWGFLKPMATVGLIVLVLQYTGLMSSVSFITGSALMKTGVMDIDVEGEGELPEKNFDYNFDIRDMDGSTVNMSSYKGKVVFINLWATWCGPCRVEMPSIQELYNHVDKDKIIFVMLSLDTEENQPKVTKYIREKGFSFPVFQPASQLPRQLQVGSIPTTVVIGKDGKIKMKKVGTANYATSEFQNFLNELTAQ